MTKEEEEEGVDALDGLRGEDDAAGDSGGR